jgi:hypothetical protein
MRVLDSKASSKVNILSTTQHHHICYLSAHLILELFLFISLSSSYTSFLYSHLVPHSPWSGATVLPCRLSRWITTPESHLHIRHPHHEPHSLTLSQAISSLSVYQCLRTEHINKTPHASNLLSSTSQQQLFSSPQLEQAFYIYNRFHRQGKQLPTSNITARAGLSSSTTAGSPVNTSLQVSFRCLASSSVSLRIS